MKFIAQLIKDSHLTLLKKYSKDNSNLNNIDFNYFKRENNFNYSVASLGDIYSPYLTSKQQRQYDILSEDEMRQMGISTGRPNFSYKKYNKPNMPQDPNLKNVSINQVDLGKGLSKNVYLNQGKPAGQLKGHKYATQRPTSAISTKKMKYNQDLDPAQRNRIIDVNYLHLTKLPESKKILTCR
jgi:hypothetical protein